MTCLLRAFAIQLTGFSQLFDLNMVKQLEQLWNGCLQQLLLLEAATDGAAAEARNDVFKVMFAALVGVSFQLTRDTFKRLVVKHQVRQYPWLTVRQGPSIVCGNVALAQTV